MSQYWYLGALQTLLVTVSSGQFTSGCLTQPLLNLCSLTSVCVAKLDQLTHSAFMVCATKKTVSRMAGLHLHSRIVTVGACSACGELCLRCKFPFEHFQITWEIVNSSMIAALLPIATASGTKWEWMSVSPVNVCQERALLEMVTIKKVYQNNNGARKKYSLQFGFIYH